MPARRRRPLGIVALFALTLVACSPSESATSISLNLSDPDVPPAPALNSEMVRLGEDLYMAQCASCHGVDLEGQPDWRTPKKDGSYPAPPHDASGHTWHHSDQVLLELIRDGLDLPESRMPTFGGQLSDDEITSIVEFLKSTWGDRERAFQWQVTWQAGQRAD